MDWSNKATFQRRGFADQHEFAQQSLSLQGMRPGINVV